MKQHASVLLTGASAIDSLGVGGPNSCARPRDKSKNMGKSVYEQFVCRYSNSCEKAFGLTSFRNYENTIPETKHCN